MGSELASVYPVINRREFTRFGFAGLLGGAFLDQQARCSGTVVLLNELSSPVLFEGTEKEAFRDPAAIFHQGWFYLYFTLMRKAEDGVFYSHLAWSKSRDLHTWSKVVVLTPPDKNLEYGSPGNIIRHNGEWILCLQTYPRPHGERYGNLDSRIWIMRSQNLEIWSEPELLRVKGPQTPREAMGRMIDPYLLHDKDRQNVWWCFYKQNGISLSKSNDLTNWSYVTKVDAGENPCVIVDHNEYVLFHSPPNGIGIKRSSDLLHWKDEGVITLGQSDWDWAKGRITAAFVLDLRHDHEVGKALMFFHASRFPEEDPRGGFDNFASIGIAWSQDLHTWDWPGKAAI